MIVKTDEVLEVLEDVMDNGGKLPQAVSNRMLLAAIRKNYRVSASNSGDIKDHENKISKIDKKITVLVFALVVMITVIAWYTGVDLGWLPLL